MSKKKQALKKAMRKFSDESIYQSLTANGKKIEDYFIALPEPNALAGQIFYWWKGKIWVSMNNDDFHLACIDFLKRNGVPIFTEDSELNKYEEKLKTKFSIT